MSSAVSQSCQVLQFERKERKIIEYEVTKLRNFEITNRASPMNCEKDNTVLHLCVLQKQICANIRITLRLQHGVYQLHEFKVKLCVLLPQKD